VPREIPNVRIIGKIISWDQLDNIQPPIQEYEIFYNKVRMTSTKHLSFSLDKLQAQISHSNMLLQSHFQVRARNACGTGDLSPKNTEGISFPKE